MDVGQRAEQLVDVELHLQHGHRGLELVEVAGRPVNGLWDILEHQVEIHLIFLQGERDTQSAGGVFFFFFFVLLRWEGRETKANLDTHPVAVGIVEGLQLHDVGMTDNPHDLQFTIL